MGAAAQQFDRMANAFDDRGRVAAKAAHLQTDVNELATQAGRILYQAIDGGAWRGQWPWARGRKPARDLFIYKDDFSMIPSDQVTDMEANPERFRDGERFRLPRPEVLPDELIKPDRMASAFWIAAINVAGQYPNAFRINPYRLDVTDAEGDEADRLAFWRRRADVFADACRFISTLLRQQPPLPDEPAGAATPPPSLDPEKAKHSPEESGGRRRGRLTKDDGKAKRAHLLATIREHPSLKDDARKLASMIGVSESSARRWIKDEERQYRESRAAQPAEDDEE